MNLVLLVNHMHFLHGHLIGDFLVFPAIIAWQGDINEVNFLRLFALQELEELDLCHTYWTKSIIQHLHTCRLAAEGPELMSAVTAC